MTDYSRDIEKYIKGELTPAERYALERKALHDPFLADALEGAEQIKAAEFSKDVAALHEKIAGKKVISVWMWPARIAAGLLIVALSTFIIWSVVETEPVQDLALQKSEPASTPAVPADSITPSTGELSSTSAEQPVGGPSVRDKDVASRSAKPTKVNPQQAAAEEPKTNEPIADAIIIAEAEETKAAEPAAEIKPAEQQAALEKADAEDDRARQLAKNSDKKKEAAARRDVAPAVESKAAGVAASSVASNVIRGQVTSIEDGSPLPGVNVIIKGSTIGTATDEAGNYQVTATNPSPTLVYSFIGLQSTEVKVENRQEVNVQMSQDVTQLSEVVTVGSGIDSDESPPPTVDLAHPETGNRAFKQYLEKNIQYPEQARINKVEGRVTVEFTIEPNGSLSNFIIIRGIGSGCDEELIRLIKEGPKWVPTKKDNVPVQDKANVRLKFELPK